tara:strand:- start:2883 stop:3302 length:420 start_codon:yes stop_codon:yes gene_type:complete
MAKTGNFIHGPEHVFSPVPALSTSFGGASAAVSLNSGALVFKGHISGVWLYVDTIAASAARLTLRLTRDAAGDEIILPDTQSDPMSVGAATATDGTAVFKFDLDWTNAGTAPTGDTVYPWVKTDAGTCNLKSIKITWSE